jgi:hypothetical protein
MQIKAITVVFIVLLGCKPPFSETPETALVLPLKIEKTKESVVFIAGFDEGSNTYYTNAKNHFEAKGMSVIDNLFSMEEIITWLNQRANDQTSFSEIHIVSHSNAWLGMSLRTTKTGERITLKTIRKAKQENSIPKVQDGICNETKLIFHSCGLGENQDLLNELKSTFANNTNAKTPKVYASTFFNVFGGKFAGHYLARPYYGYYPTGESKGPAYLSEEFKKAYPETKIDWFSALKTRNETNAGVPYSYKFNIPVNWEFTFDDPKDIPIFNTKETIMDFVSESSEMAEILFELNIPIEKYRWKSEIQGNKLLIKGKTTVLCVLAPILQNIDKSEYRKPTVDDRSIYQTL